MRWSRGENRLGVRARRLANVGALCGATLLIAACGSSSSSGGSTASHAAAADTNAKPGHCSSYQTVTFGSVGSVTDAGVILAQDLGYFHRYCITLKYDRVTNAPDLTTGLASNALQVAGIAESPGMYTSLAQGLNLRIVGDKQSCTASLCSNGVLVRKQYLGSTEAQTFANAKGTKIALASLGDNTRYQVGLQMGQVGANISNYHPVVMPFPDMVGAIEQNQVQIIQTLEPFVTKALKSGCCVFYSTSQIKAVSPKSDPPTLVPLVYGPYMLSQAHQQTAQDFMDAYVLGVRAYDKAIVDGVNRQQVYKLIASYPAVDMPVSTYAATHKAYLDPDQLATGSSGQHTLSWLAKVENYYIGANLMPKSAYVQPAKMVDLTYARNAVKSLGTFK